MTQKEDRSGKAQWSTYNLIIIIKTPLEMRKKHKWNSKTSRRNNTVLSVVFQRFRVKWIDQKSPTLSINQSISLCHCSSATNLNLIHCLTLSNIFQVFLGCSSLQCSDATVFLAIFYKSKKVINFNFHNVLLHCTDSLPFVLSRI